MVFVAGQKIRASELNATLPVFGRTTSDVSVNNTTTFADATGLSVAVEANAVYALTGFIKYASGATPDIKFCLIGPTGAGGNWGIHGLIQSASASTGSFEAFVLSGIGSSNQLGLGGNGIAAGNDVWGSLAGHITTGSTSGTLKLQFTQVTANASNTFVRSGSWIRIDRIA